jgi:hypothetical protein
MLVLLLTVGCVCRYVYDSERNGGGSREGNTNTGRAGIGGGFVGVGDLVGVFGREKDLPIVDFGLFGGDA